MDIYKNSHWLDTMRLWKEGMKYIRKKVWEELGGKWGIDITKTQCICAWNSQRMNKNVLWVVVSQGVLLQGWLPWVSGTYVVLNEVRGWRVSHSQRVNDASEHYPMNVTLSSTSESMLTSWCHTPWHITSLPMLTSWRYISRTKLKTDSCTLNSLVCLLESNQLPCKPYSLKIHFWMMSVNMKNRPLLPELIERVQNQITLSVI